MRKIVKLWVCCIVMLALVPSVVNGQQSFDGQLDIVHYRAPEFPPPVNMSTSGAPSSAPVNPIQESAPRGGVGGMPAAVPSPQPDEAPSFTSNGITWINSRPLTMRELRGQVVLIDFWEYTCINCIRTFDTNKKWFARYHRDGFQIVGVHDPEFSIAFSVKNARAAVKRFKLPYPIVVDDDRLIWNAYHSDSWPNRFLIDANGYVRYHRAGEGGDRAFEQAIRQLLVEAHSGLQFPAGDAVPPPENAFAPGCGIATPEMYVGDWYGRGILANPEGYHLGKSVKYYLPAAVEDGRVVLSGRWETYHDGMTYRGKKGKSAGELEMRYHARQLYAVMNVSRGHPGRLYVTQDGKNLTNANKGIDVRLDAQGRSYIEVREPRMYYLVANPSFGSHSVVLTPTAPGITINSFTFGNNCQTDFSHL